MTSDHPLEIGDLFAAYPDATEAELGRLHERLAERAAAQGILDVAYRTVDTPVGTLLLAATETALIRVAYETEGHDEVLATLAARISPRILHAPGRLDAAARELVDALVSPLTCSPACKRRSILAVTLFTLAK